jgi:AAA domain
MPRLIHLNGPPGIGKSTLSALYADRHPGTLNLDVDTLHHLIGGWQDEQTDTWPAVWSLVRTMAATHLGGGRDVVLPQYLAERGGDGTGDLRPSGVRRVSRSPRDPFSVQ